MSSPPPTTRTYDLATFSLTEMAECASAVRRCGSDAQSMEEAADAITTFLRQRLVDHEQRPAAVLVRVFATAALDHLDPRVREVAQSADPSVQATTPCLTLLATAGDAPAWNDRRASRAHQVIPLTDEQRVRGLPMISGLLTGLGLDIESVVRSRSLQAKESFDVFHVEHAAGSPLIPDQEFVRTNNIRSAIGFGGVLPSGRVFAVVLFSREHITPDTAELFGPVGISVRLALLPFDSGAMFATGPARGPGPRDVRAEAIAYAQLLEAFESTATSQASRLEQALAASQAHQRRVEAEARVVETLHHVGSTLAGQLDLDQIVDVATDAATAVTGAKFGAFFYNTEDDSGESYQLFKVAGVPQERFEDFPMPRNTAVFEPTFRGAGVVRSADITTDPRYGHNPPHHGLPDGHLPVRSYLAVPVKSETGEVLGGIFLGHDALDVFDERDERLATGVASQAAKAIDTARLYRAERQARRAAERTAEQLASLQASTAGLAQAQTIEEVARVVVAQGASGLEASGATLFLRDGQLLRAVAAHGHDIASPEWGPAVELRPGLPLTDAMTGAPVFLGDREELARRYPALARQPSSTAALALLPFSTEGGEQGAVVFRWSRARRFSGEDRQFMLALASQCSQAIVRARLAEAERANARRQLFLAEASEALADTLATDETIQTAVRVCIGDLATSASIHLTGDDGLHLRAAASADADLHDHLGRILADEPIRTSDRRLLGVVEGSGPVRFDRLDDLDLSTGIDRGWAVMGDTPMAAAAVPLEARTICFGVLSVARPQPYDDGDLALLENLAGRIAVAIDNARLHEGRSETAILLQRSLLPPHLPGIPGLEVDVRYRALAKNSELGGDFYDVFRIGRGQWGAVIGDVCGKGVAAASLTALARFTARAAALGGASVTEVLGVVNRAVLDEGVEDRFCTMIAMVVEPEGEAGAIVRFAVGGHPLPMVVNPGAGVRTVGQPGMVVGLFEEADWSESEVLLRSGEAMVLYTDGVTEARSPSGEFAPRLLDDVLRQVVDGAPTSASAIVEEIERRVLAFEHGEQRDDMAVMAMRAVGPGQPTRTAAQEFDRRFPPIAASVPMARHEVSSWLRQTDEASSEIADELLLVVTELATNAMRAARTGFHLRLWLEGTDLVLELADDGPGFDDSAVPDGEEPELMAERGRGLFLLRRLMDHSSVESNEGGTVVRARKRLPGAG